MRRFSVFATMLSLALALPVMADEAAQGNEAPKAEHTNKGKHKGHHAKKGDAKKDAMQDQKANMPSGEPSAAAPAAPAPAAGQGK